MPTIEDTVKDLNDKRLRAWEAGKEILDRAVDEKRALTAEEKAAYDKADDEITRIDATVDALVRSDEAKRERQTLDDEFRRVATPDEHAERSRRQADENERLMRFFEPLEEGRSTPPMTLDIGHAARMYRAIRDGARGAELRLVGQDSQSSAGGSLLVPTDLATTIYEFMTASVAMRRMRTTILTTNSGNPIDFPRVATHGIATQVANEDTAFAGTDPVFGKMTLNAFDSGQLVKVANNFVEDSEGIDVLGFVARNIGRAIGEHTAQWYVAGTGSGQPNGVMTATSSGANTGGSLIDPTVETLIDLEFSVVDTYRNNAEWLMRDATAKVIRKLRDGAGGTIGAFLWEPSPTRGLIGGQPDTFLGYPVFTDPNVASLASNARVVAFGDFSAFYIRDVRDLRLERSDHLAFDKNQIAFRGQLRSDADLIDTNAIKHQARNV